MEKIAKTILKCGLIGTLLVSACAREQYILPQYWDKEGMWTKLYECKPKPVEVVDFYPCDGFIDGLRTLGESKLSKIARDYRTKVDSNLVDNKTENFKPGLDRGILSNIAKYQRDLSWLDDGEQKVFIKFNYK